MPTGINPLRVKRHAVTQPLDNSYKLIPITQGQNAMVDAEDYEWLMRFRWQAVTNPTITGFYAMRCSGQKILMHRYLVSCTPDEEVDHKNRNTLDNRKKNLRTCTRTQNATNRGPQANNSSGFKGVSWDKLNRKWVARIAAEGKMLNLGRYGTAREAAKAYDTAAHKYHRDFAYQNLF